MRLIYTCSDQNLAQKLSEFLKKEGIDNLLEITTNRDWGSPNYGDTQCTLWIIEEDQLDLAHRWIAEYEAHPDKGIFKSSAIPPPPLAAMAKPQEKELPFNKQALGVATLYILICCSLLFLFGQLSEPSQVVAVTKLPATPLYMPEIYKSLLYDYPYAFTIIDKVVKAYGIEKLQNLADLPAEGQLLLKQFANTPYWQGIYNQLVIHLSQPEAPWNFTAPLFEKIRQGEVWRLITPIFLHANIFHLFFNMLWLIVLGKLIEDRLGILRYLLFILIVAAISNTAQYLMSGPNFVGISGVIVGMLCFIWSRQKLAPWEGYRLSPGIFTFMLAFIFGIAFIQFIAFIQEAFWQGSSFPAIASTAHLVGGGVGLLLGRLNFFRMSPT